MKGCPLYFANIIIHSSDIHSEQSDIMGHHRITPRLKVHQLVYLQSQPLYLTRGSLTVVTALPTDGDECVSGTLSLTLMLLLQSDSKSKR